MIDKAAPTTPQSTEIDTSRVTESPVEPVAESPEAISTPTEPELETAGETSAQESPVAEAPIEAAAGDEASGEPPAVEEPVVEERAVEERVVQEPVVEEPAVEEVVIEAQATEEVTPSEPEDSAPIAEKPAEPVSTATVEAPAETAPEAPSTVPVEAATDEATAGESPAEDEGGGEIAELRLAKDAQTAVEGKVIGWNNGGFHVVIGELTAFCPRSEMEIASPKAPRNYVDKTFSFHVLKVQKKGRRVVLSRASHLRGERSAQRDEIRDRLSAGSIVKGKVASLTDFGAFVDLGGVQGLVHVSEISRNRINSPSDVLEVGQEIEVKVLKLEKGGRRISLSMRALEPDPWREVKEKFPEGSTQIGKVEKATTFGAFIELEPGLTGLLPLSAMSIPRDTSPARVYPPGKEVKVLVMSVDSRRRRISLALEGSTLEGTQTDFKSYQKEQGRGTGASGFNAMEEAFRRLGGNADS